MASRTVDNPFIVIVGPTASGKTDLAIAVAKEIGGEIICADSRTVYKGMDIGTAKPTPADRAQVPHFGLDLVEPGQRFTAADFQQYAFNKIDEISARQNIPVLVGGTGLYIDAVLFNYQFVDNYNPQERELLSKMSIRDLQEHCIANSIALPVNQLNKRHLISAIEKSGINNERTMRPLKNSMTVGITIDKQELVTRITKRVHKMFDLGVVNEATNLAERYGWESEAMTASIYRLLQNYIEGSLTQAQIIEKTIYSDLHLAKRQMTWFKRNPYITWSDDGDFLKTLCVSSVN